MIVATPVPVYAIVYLEIENVLQISKFDCFDSYGNHPSRFNYLDSN
jgi:hypothetical protein